MKFIYKLMVAVKMPIFLAFELLVVKRVAKTIYFTRLPTGHTHEDIDAVFEVLWEAFELNNCETLEKHKQVIEAAFVAERIKATFVDICICIQIV